MRLNSERESASEYGQRLHVQRVWARSQIARVAPDSQSLTPVSWKRTTTVTRKLTVLLPRLERPVLSVVQHTLRDGLRGLVVEMSLSG